MPPRGSERKQHAVSRKGLCMGMSRKSLCMKKDILPSAKKSRAIQHSFAFPLLLGFRAEPPHILPQDGAPQGLLRGEGTEPKGQKNPDCKGTSASKFS